jgi:hypothetical protein
VATFVPGWTYQPQAIEAVRSEFAAEGLPVSFADGRPDLKDYHKQFVKSSICESELKLFGKFLDSWTQARGTCVSQGTGRACQFANFAAIVKGVVAGDPLQIAAEPIYGGSRVNIGGGQLGGGDGSIGAWAARYVHKYGVHCKGVYGRFDLSNANEMVGVNWGMPRQGVPAEVLNDPKVRKGIRAYECETIEQVWDALCADSACALCCNTLFSGRRDSNGCLRPSGSGGHCTGLVDYVVAKNGEPITIYQQSWGNGAISGSDEIECKDGSIYKLGPGRCGIYLSDMKRCIRDGGSELWCFSASSPWVDGVKPGEYL